ncbi:MAG: hypothetical protein QM704_20505 [Anaeromyxobacteraceae bacterium]
MPNRWTTCVLGALSLALPVVAGAVPVGGASRVVAGGPGDQAGAVLDAGQFAFTSSDAAGARVLLGDLATGATRVAATGASEPDLARNVLAYRTPAGIALQFTLTGALLRQPSEPGAAAPVVSAAAAAWESGPAGDRDIAWYQPVTGVSGTLALAGDQRAPAISGSTLALVDEGAGGGVRLFDLVRREHHLLTDGPIASVSVDGAGADLHAAVVRRSAATGLDVEVLDATGVTVAALREAGDQRAPRLSGSWVAFEDLSAGRPVAVLWNWSTGLAFVPRHATGAQVVGDVLDSGDALTLALSESNGTDLDVVVYTLPLPVVDDGGGGDWPPKIPPARCDDPDAVELASLVVARDRPEAQAGEVSFSTVDGKDLGILLCIDEQGFADATVAVDGVVVAAPADFVHPAAHLERRRVALAGTALVSGGLTGAIGSELRIRVVEDPAGTPLAPALPGDPGGSTTGAGGGAPGTGTVPVAGTGQPPPGASPAIEADPVSRGAGGCGAGPAGPLAMLALAVWFTRRRTAIW